MGYYMRFFTTDKNILSFDELQNLIKLRDANYQLEMEESASRPSANILFSQELLGVLEINKPADGLFEEEIEELLEFLEDSGGGNRKQVEDTLKNATAIFAIQVLLGDRDTDETFDLLDTIWGVLFTKYTGLLQADDEGYYDSNGLILQVD